MAVSIESPRRNVIRAVACVAALVLLHVAWLAVLGHRLGPMNADFQRRGLPYVTIFSSLGFGTEFALALIALLESALLYVTYRAFLLKLRRRTATLVIGLAALLMLGVSLRPAFVAVDAYYYVFYAKAPTLAAAYRPAPATFTPGFEPLGTMLTERPLLPSVYGPVWQILDRAIVGPARTLRDAIAATRLFGALALVLFVAMVVLLDVPVAAKAIVAVNPALYYLYVVDAHNDIVPLATLAAGLVLLGRKYLLAAAVCGVAAGAMKVSFIVVAVATLSTRGSLRTRILTALGIAFGAALVSYALGGNSYVHAMVDVGTKQGAVGRSHLLRIFRLAVQAAALLTAVAAVFVAIAYRRLLAWASFTFPAVSGLVHSWYFPWALPYAMRAKETLVPLAVALPLLTVFTEPSLSNAFHFQPTSYIIACAVVLTAYEAAKNRAFIPIDEARTDTTY